MTHLATSASSALVLGDTPDPGVYRWSAPARAYAASSAPGGIGSVATPATSALTLTMAFAGPRLLAQLHVQAMVQWQRLSFVVSLAHAKCSSAYRSRESANQR